MICDGKAEDLLRARTWRGGLGVLCLGAQGRDANGVVKPWQRAPLSGRLVDGFIWSPLAHELSRDRYVVLIKHTADAAYGSGTPETHAAFGLGAAKQAPLHCELR